MPQVFNPDGTRIGDPTNPVVVNGLVQTTAGVDPGITGVYSFSIGNAPGVVAANNFVSLFVPSAALFSVIFGGAFISSTTASGSTETEPLRAFRITTATAGTLQAATAPAKFISDYANPAVEIRTANPTVTLGSAIFSSPPAISSTTASTVVHQVTPPVGLGGFLLQAGEGIVLRTAAGDADQRWNISLLWGEHS